MEKKQLLLYLLAGCFAANTNTATISPEVVKAQKAIDYRNQRVIKKLAAAKTPEKKAAIAKREGGKVAKLTEGIKKSQLSPVHKGKLADTERLIHAAERPSESSDPKLNVGLNKQTTPRIEYAHAKQKAYSAAARHGSGTSITSNKADKWGKKATTIIGAELNKESLKPEARKLLVELHEAYQKEDAPSFNQVAKKILADKTPETERSLQKLLTKMGDSKTDDINSAVKKLKNSYYEQFAERKPMRYELNMRKKDKYKNLADQVIELQKADRPLAAKVLFQKLNANKVNKNFNKLTVATERIKQAQPGISGAVGSPDIEKTAGEFKIPKATFKGEVRHLGPLEQTRYLMDKHKALIKARQKVIDQAPALFKNKAAELALQENIKKGIIPKGYSIKPTRL